MDPVEEAFRSIKREDFLPEYLQGRAGLDMPLPIGFGQTNSQPTTVRLMLRWLEPEPGDKILDVGSGSGWTSALLAALVGRKGHVYAVEKIPELVRFGRDNAERAGVTNATFHQAGSKFGLERYAPYDRILVSASAENFPDELLRQLKDGGKMVVPVRNDILEIEKSGAELETKIHAGFVFVPLVG